MKWNINRRKLIKNTNGAISLFLMVIMMPFITTATILIEVNRFNSCISVLDELMGSSSVSVLANYDEFVRNRFGILSIRQDRGVDALYEKYLSLNGGIMGNSLSFLDLDVSGGYPLTEDEILMRQIMEFSTFNAPAKLVVEGLNLDFWISKLENLGGMRNIFDQVKAGADAITQADNLGDNIEKFGEWEEKFKTYEHTYNLTYNTFNLAVIAYANALDTEPPTDPGELTAYNNNLTTKKNAVASARTQYQNAQETIKTAYEQYITILNANAWTLTGLGANMVGVTGDDGFINLTNGMRDNYDDAFAGYNVGSIEPYISSFASQITKVDNELKIIPDSSFFLTRDNLDNYKTGLPSGYHTATVGGYVTGEDCEQFAESQAEIIEDATLESFISGVANVLNESFKTETFMGRGLDAVIDTGFYDSICGGLPGGAAAADTFATFLMDEFNNIKNALDEIGDAFTDARAEKNKDKNIFEKIVDWAVAVVKAIWAVIKFVFTVIKMIVDLLLYILNEAIIMVNNLIQLFTNYERVYLGAYSVYNMPCRTDYDSFMPMTGVTMPAIGPVPGADLNAREYRESPNTLSAFPLLGEIMGIVNTVSSFFTGGSKKTFYGADVEYILFGNTREVVNQVYTFASIYLLRFIIDVVPTVLIAQGDPLWAPLQIPTFGLSTVALALLEPLIDCVLLVNGSDVAMIKTGLHLSVDGAKKLISALTPLKIDKPNFSLGSLEILPLGYKEHCMLLMCVKPTRNQILARIKNIAQMESYFYHNRRDTSYNFQLRKAYTFINAKVNAKVNAFIPLPELPGGSLFQAERVQMRGY